MCSILMFLTILGKTLADEAGISSNEVINPYGYRYSGSYSSGSGNANFDSGVLNQYFKSLRKHHEHFLKTQVPQSFALTSASSNNADVQAKSSITFILTNNRYAHVHKPGVSEKNFSVEHQVGQFSIQNSANVPSSTSANYNMGNGIVMSGKGIDGSAIAWASLGPQGAYQTAAVFPENPNFPNIFSRFAETSQPGAGTGGGHQYGVFTSSISSSSNLNGKPQNFHKATTTVDDNGRISTYTVSNP